MKVICNNCGAEFDFEENRGVCPKCKKFHSQKNDKKDNFSIFNKKEEKDIKPKSLKEELEQSKEKVAPKENKQTENVDKKSNIDKSKIKQDKNKVKKTENKIVNKPDNKENFEPKRLFNRKEDEKQRKYLIMIIALFVLIILIPITNALLVDKAQEVGGGGTLLSSVNQRYTINSSNNYLLEIKEVGYTNRGNLYIEYESNILGFADYGYEIEMYVNDEEGNTTLLKYKASDLKYIENEDYYTYRTRATSDYTSKNIRPVSIRIVISDVTFGNQTSYTYDI